jgi:hypothetical protein
LSKPKTHLVSFKFYSYRQPLNFVNIHYKQKEIQRKNMTCSI